MKKKTTEVKEVREVSLTVRLTEVDKQRLQQLRTLLSPYAPLSEGKAISAAIKIAVDQLGRP